MYSEYFPACTVDGPIEPPVEFRHMGSRGAIPYKCSQCSSMFEGSCLRASELIQGFLHLDYGPCGIDGSTKPVYYENKYYKSKVQIPEKCSKCHFLEVDVIRGFHCKKDEVKWGDFNRGLDWGAWQPNRTYIQLSPPKITTKALIDHLYENDLLNFIKEYRRINPNSSVAEAKEDFSDLKRKTQI